MKNEPDRAHVKFPESAHQFVCDQLDASVIHSATTMQALWGGQGSLLRLCSNSPTHPSCVLKLITPDRAAQHPRGWNGKRSHERKAQSYRVERYWYEHYANRCHSGCRVPASLGTHADEHASYILLEDLSSEYPSLCSQLSISEVQICLRWLAEFHAKFLDDSADGLWEEGCYWHLSTRPDEFAAMDAGPVKEAAVLLDEKLKCAQFQTLVHGDAKVANFCFNETMSDVAAVDFQYVGRGCGIKDIAYFLGSCLSDTQCAEYETQLLDHYFYCLHNAIDDSLDGQSKQQLETEWRSLYPIAWTDFYRFLLGWMPGHPKIHSYTLALCHRSLSEL
ncbi:MAG: oxidoreductase family protein [Granulosicoccus sp.]